MILFLDTYHNAIHPRPGGIPARNAKGERLLLFLGIIDILQSYRLKKKVEHTLKSMLTDGVSGFHSSIIPIANHLLSGITGHSISP